MQKSNSEIELIENETDKKYLKAAITHFEKKQYSTAFFLFDKIKDILEFLPYEFTHLYLKSFILQDIPYIDFDLLSEPYNNYFKSIKSKSDIKIGKREKLSVEDFIIQNMHTYELNSIIDFCFRYSRKTIEHLVNDNPKFILTEITKSKYFVLNPKVFLKFNLGVEKKSYQAILINYAKLNLLADWEIEKEMKKYRLAFKKVEDKKKVIDYKSVKFEEPDNLEDHY